MAFVSTTTIWLCKSLQFITKISGGVRTWRRYIGAIYRARRTPACWATSGHCSAIWIAPRVLAPFTRRVGSRGLRFSSLFVG